MRNFETIDFEINGVRCVLINNKEMYFAKDVIRLLKYRNVRQTIFCYCNHYPERFLVVVPGEGPRSTALIDKNDVYNLIRNCKNKNSEDVIQFAKRIGYRIF